MSKFLKRKYWICKYIDMCPVCGKECITRQRKYSKKPKDYKKRNVVEEVYDWCNE